MPLVSSLIHLFISILFNFSTVLKKVMTFNVVEKFNVEGICSKHHQRRYTYFYRISQIIQVGKVKTFGTRSPRSKTTKNC